MLGAAVLVLSASACGPACDEVRIERGGTPVTSFCVTRARTEPELREGLAGREGLSAGEALWMELPIEGEVCITNAPVRFGIDVAFADDAGVITRIERAWPAGDPDARCVLGTRRVLETRAGDLEAVAIGDTIR